MYKIMLGESRLLGRISFRSEITSPDGPSTGGGVQAMQHVMLIPVQGGAPLVVGHANKADQTAQIRSYDHVASHFRSRFKADVPFARNDYEAYMAQVWRFLQSQDLAVTTEPFKPPPAAPPTQARGPGLMVVVAIVVIAIAIALIIAFSV